MNQSLQIFEKSVSGQIQQKISMALGLPLTRISNFFSVLHLPENGLFIFDAIKRVATLRCHFIEYMSDDLNAEFIETVQLAEKIIQSSVFSQIIEHFFQVSLYEWVKQQDNDLAEEELHDRFFSEIYGNCVKKPIYLICLYPVYLGNFGKDHEDVFNEYYMILGAILNRHFINKKESLDEKQSTALLYQISIEARKFVIHHSDKLNLVHCRSVGEVLEELNSVPYSEPNRERIRLIARFIKGQNRLKTFPTKQSKNIKSFNSREIIRGVFKRHHDFLIDEIDFSDDLSILFLEKVPEDDDAENNNDCFAIPVEDPKLPKTYTEKGLNGYHRKHQNLIIPQIPISDNRLLLALLWKISRNSGVESKSGLKAVIYILLAMLTGSNPRNISTPKHLKENEEPILGRINLKVVSPYSVQIFIPVLTAKTKLVEGLDCYENHASFFEVTLPKVFSNILFHILRRYEDEFQGDSLAFDDYLSKAIKRTLESVKGAGLTVFLVVKNTVRLLHKASNGSTYIAHCFCNNPNSLATTQKHYASVSKSLLNDVFFKMIQEQFEINTESYMVEEAIYLGTSSLVKHELLSEKIAYYFDRSLDKEASVLSQFNNLQKLLAFIQFIFSACRNVKKNKPFHQLCLDQRPSQLYDGNRKPKSINVFFWDDKRTKNGSNIRFLVAPDILEGLLLREQKLIKKLEKEQMVLNQDEEQFFTINYEHQISHFLQSELAKLDFDEDVRPNFLRAWVFSTLLNQIMSGALNISAETLDAFMGHGHAGSEFWNPYSLKDPQVSFQEQMRFVESLEVILNIQGDKK